ncbi:hypothetical protein H4R19_002438 [Coemansia spiralis]|nr:hypothetical protein H4R19_002438 [Coemansia spiralis]
MTGGNGHDPTQTAVYTDVTRDNIEALAVGIRTQIARAKFISIDTEFTGLVIGNASPVFRFNTAEWVTRAADMRERYRAMSNVAKTHALVSMGLCTFAPRHTVPGSYNAHGFNFILQAQNTHLINPASLTFLAQNGFDLSKQAAQGIRYFSGPNPRPVQVKTPEINTEGALLRDIFLDLVRARRPIVIHNGLFDLVYLYQSFFGPLPDSYESFACDLHQMFPGGVYDTKYMAESLCPGDASYLAYAYHKNRRVQKSRESAGDPAVQIKLKVMAASTRPPSQPAPTPPNSADRSYCEGFAAHGHCRLKDQCPRSHSIDHILDCQEKEREQLAAGEAQEAPSNKRKSDEVDGSSNARPTKALKAGRAGTAPEMSVHRPAEASNELAAAVTTLTVSDSSGQDMCHTAAYDAYMTGYIFASLRILHGDELEKHKNKVYRMGRSSEPLLIQASQYAATSITYGQTMLLVEASQPPKAAASTDGTSSSPSSDSSSSDDGSDGSDSSDSEPPAAPL